MMYGNALRNMFGPRMNISDPQGMLPVGWQEQYGGQNTFNPIPFEGGIPNQGKGGLYGPFSGPFNVPNMGTNVPRNALMGFGGGFRRPGMMGIRQRY